MDQHKVEVEGKIFNFFKEENVKIIVLVGQTGIGKTWMAKKVSRRAIRERHFDITLWVYLSVRHDEMTLYRNIARQLSLLSISMELEIDDNEVMEESDDEEENIVEIKKKILESLSNKRLLLILDDERNSHTGGKLGSPNINGEEVTKLCKFLEKSLRKVLVTSDCLHDSTDSKKVISVEPLDEEKSLSLFWRKAGAEVVEDPGAKLLIESFISRNNGITPAEVGMIAKLFSYHISDSGTRGLERVLEEVKDNISCKFLQLFRERYKNVPYDILVDISFKGSHVFQNGAAVHFSELISYWIIEGYLDHIVSIHLAFEEGHRILLELMDCGVLKKVDANHLIVRKESLDLDSRHRHGFGGTAKLGLANVFADDCNWSGFGKVAPRDGTITSVGSDRKGWKQTTLLLDENCLQREELAHFLDSNQELKTLGLFHPRFKEFSLPKMKNLSVLLLRSCEFLENIEFVRELGGLNVLEVSGANSLSSIPDDLFDNLKQLRSLNLSSLKVDQLPKSLGDLIELQWLIVKGCTDLKQLPSLQRCNKLVVLDLSGASQLENFQMKNFRSLRKLQRLDLSLTNIKPLQNLQLTIELTHLSLSGCREMGRLPSIKTLQKLQVLDLSKSGIKEFHDGSFKSNENLKILDLSGTLIVKLPSSVGNPREVYLKDCKELENFNCDESPRDLEVFDISGSSKLCNLEAKFFHNLENLRLLNLSKTSVSILPPLSALSNLRQLLLSSCSKLSHLPSSCSLRKLEVLDLSGCKSLIKFEDESFEHLSRLQQLSLSEAEVERIPELKSLTNLEKLSLCSLQFLARADFLMGMTKLESLDLSKTLLVELPYLSSLKNLSALHLSGCKQLKILPDIGGLSKLEVLDLSGSAVRQLPSLENLSNLRKLLLQNCSNMEGFKDIVVLNIPGDTITSLPFGISKLTRLEHVALPNVKNDEGSISQWSISSLARTASDGDGTFTSLNSSAFTKLLESDSSIVEKIFKDFQFCIHPWEKQNGTSYISLHRGHSIGKNDYFLFRHFSHLKGHGQILQINGFTKFPSGIESLLKHAHHIFLSNNFFIKSLADLGAKEIKMMKSCCILRCQNMVHVIDDRKDYKELGKELEILWISNALSLTGLYHPNLEHEQFQILKHLHLDCCPKLSNVFCSSCWPRSLEVLQIKFCDSLSALTENGAQNFTLPKLQSLLLIELPALENIGCIMPSLQRLEVGGCSILEHLLSSEHMPENLKVLKLRNCERLETLLQGTTTEKSKFPNLEIVELWDLPELKSAEIDFPSQLQTCIRGCPNLHTS